LGESFEGIVVERSKSSSEVSAPPEPDDDSNESLSLQDENEGDKESRFRQIAKLKFHQETQNRYDDDVLTMILNDAMLRMEAKPISSPNYFVTVLRNGVQDGERMEEHFYFLSQRRARHEKYMAGFDAGKYSDQPDEKLTAATRELSVFFAGDSTTTMTEGELTRFCNHPSDAVCAFCLFGVGLG